MRLIKSVSVLVVAAVTSAAHAQPASSATTETVRAKPATIAFVNGQWFNGSGFDRRTVYSLNCVFAFKTPSHLDTTIDLANRYVVPPFADAHNHNVEFSNDARARAIVAKYLNAGVFYDQSPLSLARGRAGMNGLVNVPT